MTKKYKYDFTQDDMPPGADWKDYFNEFDRYFDDEYAKSKALPDGLHVGKLFHIGVADGYAYYEVSKIFKTKVRLIWRRDLCPDRYADHHFQGGGSFDRGEVERYVLMQDSINKLFGKKCST